MHKTLISLALLALSSTAAQAVTYSNTYANQDIGTFGINSTTTYGQTFVVGSASVLQDWTFYGIVHSGGNNLRFAVATWDIANTRPTSEVYSATGTWVSNYVPGAPTPLSFSGMNLNLAAGTYIAYLTTDSVASGAVDGGSIAGSAGNGGLGGLFYYAWPTSTPIAPTDSNSAWTSYVLDPDEPTILANMLFTANISAAGSPVSAIPEPETYAMMLAGLGALGAVARRRRTSDTGR